MRAIQGHPGAAVSSTVTKRNPRPRKYASASERQAAYRARAPEVCFRAEDKTVDTLDKIAADLDVSRADLLLSMTNHDWARFGLTHRPLPYEYGIEKRAENPAPIWERKRPKRLGPSVPLTAAQKRKAKALAAAAGRQYPNLVDNIAASRNPSMKQPTPAQLAARARFAEMARSGAFKRKAKKNPAKRSGYRITLLDDNNEPIDSTFDTTEQGALLYAKDKVLQGMKGEITYKFPKGERLAFYFDATGIYKAGSTTPFYTPYPARAMNPAKRKKTVSQKISQLMHEGYPQKQAVAVALSEQRAGKVKRNPASGRKGSRTKLNPVKKPRMLNISWLTAGGQREVMSVPIEFTFTEYVGNVAEKFFARLENGMLIVSEYATGGKVGQVPYRMREASLNDRDAAKRFTREMIERVGPERFRAAIRKFEAIN